MHTPRLARVWSATGLGLGAVALWAGLAALTALAGPLPPFQMTALTFTIGTIAGLIWSRLRGYPWSSLWQIPTASLALGIYGLLIFHVCYFRALQLAPLIEASLIIYLWPLLIVLFSSLLPAHLGGHRLGALPVLGAGLGLCGTALILDPGSHGPAFGGALEGYLMAGAAAFIWASYSVASRLLTAVPSSAVVGSCAATAIGAWMLHWTLEAPIWPSAPTSWFAILALGLGPVGLAFYLWDEGMKHGNIRLLGVASYATPLLSTLLLGAIGLGRLTWRTAGAAALIAAGAYIASRERT